MQTANAPGKIALLAQAPGVGMLNALWNFLFWWIVLLVAVVLLSKIGFFEWLFDFLGDATDWVFANRWRALIVNLVVAVFLWAVCKFL